ncbi:MAG TPA: hypothetical protein PKK72_11370 [Chitinophagales bacterium]|nr:hypothetical protein [Chitinophagales bacterium]HNE44718.1 hypothetical protein [Chitinophagales bacterium]HNJ88795.1 hypothetical protein [Chitinophagales bacterium]HNM09175.1 hypothetical protein [Chitinophagales bacterium]HNM28275.1 hypothetical protein [Chitinophagales bacterium]
MSRILGTCLVFSICLCLSKNTNAQITSCDSLSTDTLSVIETPNSLMINSTILFQKLAVPELSLPAYTQGVFCNFEDRINKKTPLRIDFSVK